MSLRLVVMGTGKFTLPTLRGLIETNHEIVGLFTQPDRTGRGHHHHVNPMKETALEHAIPVFQPRHVNTEESLDELRSLKPDLCVVAAYGQILSAELIGIPKLGAINLHASVLPRHRGAAPVQYAIRCGDAETGVTIFQIEPKLDAGPILGIETTPIAAGETAGELESRLSELAVPLTLRIVEQLEAGNVQPLPQDSSLSTKAPRLKKSDAAIDWSISFAQIDCHIRAMLPWPTPFTFLQQADKKPLRLVILEVEPSDIEADAAAGTVVSVENNRLVVRCGDRAAEIIRLKPEGKREMSAAEFLRGREVFPGDGLTSVVER